MDNENHIRCYLYIKRQEKGLVSLEDKIAKVYKYLKDVNSYQSEKDVLELSKEDIHIDGDLDNILINLQLNQALIIYSTINAEWDLQKFSRIVTPILENKHRLIFVEGNMDSKIINIRAALRIICASAPLFDSNDLKSL